MIPLARVMLTASLGALAITSCASGNDAATVDPTEPEVSVADVRAGGTIVPGEAVQFGLNTHCGVKVLGNLNGTWWIAATITATHRDRSVVYRPETRGLTELGLLCD